MAERPSIRQLEYLVALSETLNFRQAAEMCFVSQPALSAQIQKLEEQLEVQLFERDTRRVLPTAVGSLVVERAKAVLAASDALLESARSLDDPLTGKLTLGVIPTISPYVLPKIMPAVRGKYADLRFLIREARTDQLLEGLDAGSIDCLLLALEPELGPEVEILPLFDEPFVFAMPPGHRLADQKEIPQEELAREEVLLLEDGH